MADELYYPCLKDWESGQICRRVGPAMSFEAAVQYLKQHHGGAWQQGYASPQLTTGPIFTVDASTPIPGSPGGLDRP